ncbi:PAN2-PAN3 deadenylation complex subunit PAN3 [Aphelenchoides besseyi]|nr:PAN2-PAN3 deadenylation complex subunit PAN3 [Aphelenchoides besseyi]
MSLDSVERLLQKYQIESHVATQFGIVDSRSCLNALLYLHAFGYANSRHVRYLAKDFIRLFGVDVDLLNEYIHYFISDCSEYFKSAYLLFPILLHRAPNSVSLEEEKRSNEFQITTETEILKTIRWINRGILTSQSIASVVFSCCSGVIERAIQLNLLSTLICEVFVQSNRLVECVDNALMNPQSLSLHVITMSDAIRAFAVDSSDSADELCTAPMPRRSIRQFYGLVEFWSCFLPNPREFRAYAISTALDILCKRFNLPVNDVMAKFCLLVAKTPTLAPYCDSVLSDVFIGSMSFVDFRQAYNQLLQQKRFDFHQTWNVIFEGVFSSISQPLPISYFRYRDSQVLNNMISELTIANDTKMPLIQRVFRFHWSLLLLERIRAMGPPQFDKDPQTQGQNFRDTPLLSVGRRPTGRNCERSATERTCRGKLCDFLLDWEDELPEPELTTCYKFASASDLSLCLGTSLQIEPVAKMPLLAKRNGGKFVTINLQQTKHEKKADLAIHGKQRYNVSGAMNGYLADEPDLRTRLLQRQMAQQCYPTDGLDLPDNIEHFRHLKPIGRNPSMRTGNHVEHLYKAVSTIDGLTYAVHRITTALFVYDFQPLAESILKHFFHTNGTIKSKYMGNGVPGINEQLVWNFIIQISCAIRTVHAASMAVRCLDLNRIIVNTSGRFMVSGVGITEVLTAEPSSNLIALQMEDLRMFGAILMTLLSGTLHPVSQDRGGNPQSIDAHYSPDLRNVVKVLSHAAAHNGGRVTSINEIMPMIGARFYSHMESLQIRVDMLENDLCKIRASKRPKEPYWSDTSERYMLKLFRDYVFHQVDAYGRPVLDLAHIVLNLNKLDSGVNETIQLASRDNENVLLVTYKDLRNYLETSFAYLRKEMDSEISPDLKIADEAAAHINSSVYNLPYASDLPGPSANQ